MLAWQHAVDHLYYWKLNEYLESSLRMNRSYAFEFVLLHGQNKRHHQHRFSPQGSLSERHFHLHFRAVVDHFATRLHRSMLKLSPRAISLYVFHLTLLLHVRSSLPRRAHEHLRNLLQGLLSFASLGKPSSECRAVLNLKKSDVRLLLNVR